MFGELVGRACYQRNGGTATMRFRWSSVGRVQTGTFVYQLFDCTTGHTSAGLTRRLGYETPTGTSGRAEATVKVNPAHKYRMRISGGGSYERAPDGVYGLAGFLSSEPPQAARSGRARPPERRCRRVRRIPPRLRQVGSATRRLALRPTHEPVWPGQSGRAGRASRTGGLAVDVARQSGPPSAAPVFNSARLTHLPLQRRPRRTAGGGATPCAAPEGLRRTRLTRATAAPAPSTGTRPRPLGRRRANRLLGQSV